MVATSKTSCEAVQKKPHPATAGPGRSRGAHKGPPIRELVKQAQGRLDIEPVPAHSPELIPVEFLWSWLKYDRLPNFAPRDAAHLDEAIVQELEPIREDQELLRSFFHRSALQLPRTLLS
jgi:hypothetical protein